MPERLIQLDPRKSIIRISMIFVLGLALACSWFVVRWYVGDTLAEYFNPDESSLGLAKLAVSLAPSDPITHWRLGNASQKNLPPDQMAQVVTEYERAASLSPNDYRFWMSLGPALEQVGETERAEKALRRSVELAPSYSYPAWYLGNLLLRNGRYDEAFVEFRRASEGDAELRPQFFNLAWEVYHDDFEALKKAIGETASSRAQFCQYLVGRGRFDDGLRLWNTLNESEKRTNRASGGLIIDGLIASKRFHDAASVWNDLAPGPSACEIMGRFIDGGFEDDVSHGPEAAFTWQVKSAPQLQIGIDPNQGHSGGRSLRLVFQVRARLDAIDVSQLVTVVPATSYEFECYVKTDKLQSAGPPLIEIVDATEGKSIASSETAPPGDKGWQPVTLTFKTGAKTQGIILRIARSSCGDNPVCPIFGTVWYDDFNLKRRD